MSGVGCAAAGDEGGGRGQQQRDWVGGWLSQCDQQAHACPAIGLLNLSMETTPFVLVAVARQ